jgi:hypothetical protein
MIRGFLSLLVFVSVVFFPWPLTAILALIAAFFIPLLPLAVGIFADTLYYTQHAALLPFFTLYGAIATVVAILVRSRLRASIINR